MAERLHTVFGGTGFLGRRIVRRLLERGERVRAASRHPERAAALFAGCPSPPEAVRADIDDRASVAAALQGAAGAVNAVSLYVEQGSRTFRSVHVDGARRIARAAREAGVARFVHVSGIGADPTSPSPYVRSRGEGEEAVRDAFPDATILRPAVMFGPDDAFLTRLIEITRRAPVIPLFGTGETQLEPAFVDDVAEAAVRILTHAGVDLPVYELAGPERYRYRDLLGAIAERTGRRRLFVPVPLALWHAAALAGEMLPGAPLTRNQVDLMREDNVASPGMPGFGALQIEPHTIDAVIDRKAA